MYVSENDDVEVFHLSFLTNLSCGRHDNANDVQLAMTNSETVTANGAARLSQIRKIACNV